MPQTIYYLPSPQSQAMDEIMRMFQIQRFEKQRADHFKGIEEEAKDKKTTGLVAGAVLGGLGGLAFAPAAVASSATTGAALTASGASWAAGATTAALQGAFVGAQAGAQFGEGDIAGGIGTAVGGISQGIKKKQLREAFGYEPTQADIDAIGKMAAKHDMTPTQLLGNAKAAGQSPTAYIQSIKTNAIQSKEISDIADELNVPVDYLMRQADQYGGDMYQAMQGIEAQQRNVAVQTEAEKTYARKQAETASSLQNLKKFGFDLDFDSAGLSKIDRSQDRLIEIRDLVATGEITTQEAVKLIDNEDREIRGAINARKMKKKPPDGKEVNAKNFSMVPLTLPDGTVYGYKEMIFNPGDGTTRPGETHSMADISKIFKESGGGQSFPDWFGGLDPLKQIGMLKDTMTSQILQGDDTPTQEEGVEWIEKGYNAIQKRINGTPGTDTGSAGGPVPPPGQPQPQPQQQQQQAPPPPKVSLMADKIYQSLTQEISKSPVETWEPEKLKFAEQQINIAQADIMRGEPTPAAIQMAKELIAIKRQIDARKAGS